MGPQEPTWDNANGTFSKIDHFLSLPTAEKGRNKLIKLFQLPLSLINFFSEQLYE